MLMPEEHRFLAAADWSFQTRRLEVEGWRAGEDVRGDAAFSLSDVLTEPVTRSLPSGWQGAYTAERARDWLKEASQEGLVLLLFAREGRKLAGCLLLGQTGAEESAEPRIGYLLAEEFWGQGLASELVASLVEKARSMDGLDSLAGGVAADNPASARVLEKNGFVAEERGAEETVWRLRLNALP